MIALTENLPLVRHSGGYSTPFQRDWLQNALVAAAVKAGYEQWWLANHVTESVIRYLESQFEGSVVDTEGLGKAVRSTLQAIGYGEVAAFFNPPPPPVCVPLPELAERAHTGYELAFFDLLDAELRRLLRLRVRNIRFSGLRYTVKYLRDAKRWRESCNPLRDEIVAFITSRIQRHAARREITFILA